MALTLSPRLETAMQLAGAEAARRGHRQLTTEHVLWAVVKDAESRTLVAACGADTDELERELEDYLELMEGDARGKRPEPDRAVQGVLQRAAQRALSAGAEQLDLGVVLAELMSAKEAYASMLLYAAGVTRLDVLRVVAHGTREVRVAAPDAERLVVLLHNDPFTTMEFVVLILRDVFGLDDARAGELMMRVHREGAAVVTVLPARDAIDRAARVFELAEESQSPLRVSLTAA
jgi:ATP-dependent Clp protease adapter protein ClpS